MKAFIQSEVRALTENRDSTKSSIQAKYQALRDQLNEEERGLLAQVDAWADPMLTALSAALEKVGALSGEVKEILAGTRTALGTWSDKKLDKLNAYTGEVEKSLLRASDELEALSVAVAVSGVSSFDAEGKVVLTPVCRRLATPEKFIVKSVSPYSVMLMWSVPAALRAKLPRLDKNVLYRVEQRCISTESTAPPTSSEFVMAYEGTKPTCICDKLIPETCYEFRVCAQYTGCEDRQWSGWSRVESATTKKVPTPANFAVTEPHTATIRVTWNFVPLPHSKVSSYQFGVQKISSDKNNGEQQAQQPISVVYEGRENVYVCNTLEQSTEYALYIRSGCDGVWGEWGVGVPFRTSDRFPGFWRPGPNYTVSKEYGRMATVTANGFYTTILGDACLEPNAVNNWTVRILSTLGSDIYVGFAPNTISPSEKHNPSKAGWYLYCNSCRTYTGGNRSAYGPSEVLKAGDTVSVHVDTAKAEASFSINGKQHGVAFAKIPLNVPLVPVVLCYNKGDVVEILPYVEGKDVK